MASVVKDSSEDPRRKSTYLTVDLLRMTPSQGVPEPHNCARMERSQLNGPGSWSKCKRLLVFWVVLWRGIPSAIWRTSIAACLTIGSWKAWTSSMPHLLWLDWIWPISLRFPDQISYLQIQIMDPAKLALNQTIPIQSPPKILRVFHWALGIDWLTD